MEVAKLDNFKLESGDADREGPLDEFDGDHHAAVGILGDKNSFNSIETTSSNSDPLSDSEKREQPERSVTGKQ